jgi:hypothetical protein
MSVLVAANGKKKRLNVFLMILHVIEQAQSVRESYSTG